MTRPLSGLLLVLLVTACGAARGANRGSSDVLTRDEIITSSATTALELLQQLRPQFLRSRGATSLQNPRPTYPVVYMNEVRHGGVESLRTIMAEEISEVRFISGADATTRWGTGHGAGVIQILARY